MIVIQRMREKKIVSAIGFYLGKYFKIIPLIPRFERMVTNTKKIEWKWKPKIIIYAPSGRRSSYYDLVQFLILFSEY